MLPTPSVVEQLRKSEKKQADFENLGAKLQARRQITRPAMQQAQMELRPLPTPSPGPSIPEAPPPAPLTNLRGAKRAAYGGRTAWRPRQGPWSSNLRSTIIR